MSIGSTIKKLRRERDMTQEQLAEYLGISRSTFSAKLNETNGAEFTQGEIAMIKFKYDLSPDEIDAIFFAQKVS